MENIKQKLHDFIDTLNDNQITYIYNLVIKLFGSS